jgi:DNA-binding MarR family transcriptional regulator
MRASLSEDEERAWSALVSAYESLTRALDERMVADYRMPLGMVEALIAIAHADEGSISVADLAGQIRLSPSRTSRVAMELEREGLVKRERDAADSRSTRVAATDAGRERLLEAAPAYLSTIRHHLFEQLSERDIGQLARLLERIQGPSPEQQTA